VHVKFDSPLNTEYVVYMCNANAVLCFKFITAKQQLDKQQQQQIRLLLLLLGLLLLLLPIAKR